MEKTFKDIFRAYPEQNEIYLDSNNVVWLNKNTAIQQSKGGEVKTITRLEIMGYIVFTLEPEDGEVEVFPLIREKRISKSKKLNK